LITALGHIRQTAIGYGERLLGVEVEPLPPGGSKVRYRRILLKKSG